MKLYVDFYNFDRITDTLLRESIPITSSVYGWSWAEWSGKIADQEYADISLVYANDLSWREAVLKSNLASGKWIVLVGDRAPIVGLPIVRTFFKWTELDACIGLQEMPVEILKPPSYVPGFALTMPGVAAPYLRTSARLDC